MKKGSMKAGIMMGAVAISAASTMVGCDKDNKGECTCIDKHTGETSYVQVDGQDCSEIGNEKSLTCYDSSND